MLCGDSIKLIRTVNNSVFQFEYEEMFLNYSKEVFEIKQRIKETINTLISNMPPENINK